MSKNKIEYMRRNYADLVMFMENRLDVRNLSPEKNKSFRELNEKVYKVFEEIGTKAMNFDDVSLDTLSKWKKDFDASKVFFMNEFPSYYSPVDIMEKELNKRMVCLIELASERVQNYIDEVPENAESKSCKIAFVENKLPDENTVSSELKLIIDNAKNKATNQAAKVAKKSEEKTAVKSNQEITNVASEMKVLETSLYITNASFFTKQSKQFKAFSKAVKALNEKLEKCKASNLSENAAFAKAIAEVKLAKFNYDVHCVKHPQSDMTRAVRKSLADEIMSHISAFEKDPKLAEAVRKAEAIAKKKAQEPVKNLNLMDSTSKKALVAKVRAQEAAIEKKKREAVEAAAKQQPDEKTARLIAKKTENVKNSARKFLAEPGKNVFLLKDSIWAGEEELKRYHQNVKKATENLEKPAEPPMNI